MSKVAYYAGEDFKNETLVKEGVTLVDLFATWCTYQSFKCYTSFR